MGLDMYLNVRKYVAQYSWTRDSDTGESERVELPGFGLVAESAGLTAYSQLQPGNVTGAMVEVTALYWRKANAIHRWFVDNCANGVDDCRPVYLTYGQLEELLKSITLVLDDPEEAQHELPTGAGFFFGATEYNDSYWDVLKQTKEELTQLLALSKDDDVTFVYEASW